MVGETWMQNNRVLCMFNVSYQDIFQVEKQTLAGVRVGDKAIITRG